MIIRLSQRQQHNLLEWSGKITTAHTDEESIPPGYDPVIPVSSFPATAEARCGSQTLYLGDVEVITI